MLNALRLSGNLVHKAHCMKKVGEGKRSLNDRAAARPIRKRGEFRLDLLGREARHKVANIPPHAQQNADTLYPADIGHPAPSSPTKEPRMSPRFATITLATMITCTACDSSALKDGGVWNTTIAGAPFHLTVSSSDPTRQRGLGAVTDIPVDGGMVFVFPDSEMRGFWMKDCVTDMDIIYLDPLGYVTAIHTMTKQPLRGADEAQTTYEARLKRYSSVTPAQYVIELRAGRAQELKIHTSQKLQLDAPALKAAVR